MRLLSWNIRQGGCSRVGGIINALVAHDADVIGLAECLPNEGLVKIRKIMGGKGWLHQSIAEAGSRQYALLVLSRLRFSASSPESSNLFLHSRWEEIIVDGSDTSILFAHVPDFVKPKLGMSNKEIFWQYMVEHAKRYKQEKALILGDLNTGLPSDGPEFRCVQYFKELMDLGYRDIWREYHPGTTEFTWYSRSNGFRLDHVFASPTMLSLVQNASYSHREREADISDHSLLIVDLI